MRARRVSMRRVIRLDTSRFLVRWGRETLLRRDGGALDIVPAWWDEGANFGATTPRTAVVALLSGEELLGELVLAAALFL